MKIGKIRSPQWRARTRARVWKKVSGFVRSAPLKSPVLIAGLQRSGTTMLMDILHLHPDTDVFDEARESKTFVDFRIRSLEAVRHSIESSHFRFPCFKVIADSHVLRPIMGGLMNPKVLWMYRAPGPNAVSRLRKFRRPTAAIRAVCEGTGAGGWLAEGVSEKVARRLRALDRSRFGEFDYACLAWWVRNQLFFELGLDADPNVRLLRYETLVTEPEATIHALYAWLGMTASDRSLRFVHARSMRRPDLPALDPEVAWLCGELLARLDKAHARQWSQVQRGRAAQSVSLDCMDAPAGAA